MQKRVHVAIFLIVSTLILGMTIFAREIGLDSNPGWGKGRIALLILVLLIAFIPWILVKRSATPDKSIQTDLFTFPVLLVVIGIYFWFMSVSHDATSRYYSLLAGSFRNGELSLPLNPDPALLQLANPYDPVARQGIKVPQDLSLYQGKFYLYWGPAPSLLLAMAGPIFPGKIGEVYLLFFFMCGIFLSQFLLIMYFWQRFFPGIPKWMLVLSIAFAGLANPALWLLCQPKLYEAAVAGAQFFFISGLASTVLALDRRPTSTWGLILAGTLWALAVGTRLVMVFPVAFMTLMVIYWVIKTNRSSLLKIGGGLISLGLPLLIGAAALSWYNWARFGSIFETGFTYQLAGPYLQIHLDELFLPAYAFQNLYNYLFQPFAVKSTFPFLYSVRGVIEAILPWQTLPQLYTSQAITGFLCAVPFTVFAGIPIVTTVKQFFRKNQAPDSKAPPTALPWITLSLIGSFALPLLSLLVFFWAAMRYTEDFMPSLLLLSIIGFWQGYQMLNPNPKKCTIYVTLAALLAVLSMSIAILLALSIYYTNGLL
jgi:hypothetical protein